MPRFYLQKFCDVDGLVWTYSDKNEPRADKPEATAVESNFYSPVRADGERFDEAEKLLGIFESNAAPLWECLCSGTVLTDEEREKVTLFLAAQYLRSPSSVRAGAEIMASFASKAVDLITKDDEAYHQYLADYEERTGNATSPEMRAEARKLIGNPKNLSMSVLRAAGLPILGGIPKLADIFLNMNWIVGRSRDQHLITSDCPVTRVSDPRTHSRIYGDGAFANKTVRVTFPLTPTRIVELTWKGNQREGVVEIPRKMAKELNSIRAAQAERFVYASKNDTGIVKLCKKWLEPEKRARIVMGRDTPAIDVKRKL
ncbi:MAG: DUF4238 domain-containing protein [Pseudomonadota bacterium]